MVSDTHRLPFTADCLQAAGNAQRSSNGGQGGDQRLDDGFPNSFLVHVFLGVSG